MLHPTTKREMYIFFSLFLASCIADLQYRLTYLQTGRRPSQQDRNGGKKFRYASPKKPAPDNERRHSSDRTWAQSVLNERNFGL
mmetsp:Transcript_74830/g.124630  ORF Transcript_74830/g.124630 Transcript_74830/m.124630 type:complete len:84 (-) Transcript_74830:85-336(-)